MSIRKLNNYNDVQININIMIVIFQKDFLHLYEIKTLI
jgi:hypothetical protein